MKNKKLFFSAVLCFLCAASVNLNAQIKVASIGKVSVVSLPEGIYIIHVKAKSGEILQTKFIH